MHPTVITQTAKSAQSALRVRRYGTIRSRLTLDSLDAQGLPLESVTGENPSFGEGRELYFALLQESASSLALRILDEAEQRPVRIDHIGNGQAARFFPWRLKARGA